MLAIKLHKQPKPWLGKGSHLVPIITWDVGRIHIRNWRRMLSKKRSYITLVKIPDEQPVRIIMSYGPSNFIKQVVVTDPCVPWGEQPEEVKKAMAERWSVWSAEGGHREGPGGLMVEEPELILGRKLPDRCIKWTKDIRLLYGRDKKAKHTASRDSA